MSVERLERVLWRLRKKHPDSDYPLWSDLEVAIMYECGTDRQTYYRNKRALIKLGWIVTHNRKRFRLTNNDLTG